MMLSKILMRSLRITKEVDDQIIYKVAQERSNIRKTFLESKARNKVVLNRVSMIQKVSKAKIAHYSIDSRSNKVKALTDRVGYTTQM